MRYRSNDQPSDTGAGGSSKLSNIGDGIQCVCGIWYNLKGAKVYHTKFLERSWKEWGWWSRRFARGWQGAKLLSLRRSVERGRVGRFDVHRGTGARGDSTPSMATGLNRRTTFTVGSGVPMASGWTDDNISTLVPKDKIQTHHNRGKFPHRSFDARKTNWGVRTIT